MSNNTTFSRRGANSSDGSATAAATPAEGANAGDRNARPQGQQQTSFQPVPAQEQLRLQTMRSQVATSLMHCLGECRVALKYYVLGRLARARALPRVSHQRGRGTGRNSVSSHFSKEEDPGFDALVRAERALCARIDALRNFLALYWTGSASTAGFGNARNKPLQGNDNPQRFMTFDVEALERIEYVRDKLLAVGVTEDQHTETSRVIASVVDGIENDVRVARLLPPGPGWAWSAKYDDWFRWSASAMKWVAATREELEVDLLT